jgi:hypothetical protein
MNKEADLYAPVKSLLEAQGYAVKGEVTGCDVVGRKDGAPTVIVELKLVFSLDLVLQGVDRQNLTDDVYIAVHAPDTPTKRRNWKTKRRGFIKLCRMLGLGLITVDLARARGSQTEILANPAPYAPRKNKRKQTRLLSEFVARAGDPNIGGINKTKIITAYRQDALRCAVELERRVELKASILRDATGVNKAAVILRDNHYGWFERVSRGIYRLTPLGHAGLKQHAEFLPTLERPAG